MNYGQRADDFRNIFAYENILENDGQIIGLSPLAFNQRRAPCMLCIHLDC